LNSGVWSLRLLGMGDTSAVRLLAPPVLNLSSCPIFRVHFMHTIQSPVTAHADNIDALNIGAND